MKIHIIMHESFEAPGAILDWANNNSCPVSYTRLYLGETFPEVIDFDYLMVMGGPQSPDTTTAECPHFDAEKEISFIKRVIDADKYLLGVCLGAQLIGEALGAKYGHSPNREIGVFPLMMTADASDDPIFKNFESTFNCGHWHGDMPGLTPESKILAYSEGCPRQIVCYTDKIYGFQCHFEFTPETIEAMIKNCGNELEQYKDLPYIQNETTLRTNNYTPINQLLFTFLDSMKHGFESNTQ